MDKDISQNSIDELKRRGYFNIRKVTGHLFCHIANHFLFKGTRLISKSEKNKIMNHYLNDSKFFYDVEFSGAMEFDDEKYDDYQASFTCSINPEWKYGIWINDRAKNLDDNLIYIFAQHKWDIVKFKPSYSNFVINISLDKMIKCFVNSQEGFDVLIYDLVNFMILTKHESISYGMYGHQRFDKNFHWEYIKDKFYYTIREPIVNKIGLFKDKILVFFLREVGNLSKDVECVYSVDNGENVWPRFDVVYILKSGLSEETYEKHYFKFNINKRIFNISQIFKIRQEDGSLSKPYYYTLF